MYFQVLDSYLGEVFYSGYSLKFYWCFQGCETWVQVVEREGEGVQQERCKVLWQHLNKDEETGACEIWSKAGVCSHDHW